MAYKLSCLISGIFMLFLAAGCSSLSSYTYTTQQARLSISQGRFGDALSVFPEKAARGKNEVLIRLERATLLQALGEYEESSREFQLAADRIRQYEDRAVVSAGRTASQAGSLLLNEQVQPYEGEDFEKILIHAMNAVNYLMRGDLEGARVEIRNAYRRQNELADKHAKALQKAESSAGGWERSFEKADRDGYQGLKEKAGNVHSVYQNAFAYYISSLVYELGGEADETSLRHLLRHVFSRRRKMLGRSLRDLTDDPLPALAAAGVDPAARAEQLPPETWPALLRALPRQ